MPNIIARLAGAIATVVLLATPAIAENNFSHPAYAPVGAATSIPVGAAEFCKTYRGECGTSAGAIGVEPLTEARWQQLVAINDHVNGTIEPVSDLDLYRVTEFWTYPNGRGDCEDYALEKRRHLIAAGWNASTLLMTVVRQANGEGHAVLMVRTDRGDLVLDNQDGRILVWKDTPYQYVKRQSQADSRKWVGIEDFRAPLYTASNR